MDSQIGQKIESKHAEAGTENEPMSANSQVDQPAASPELSALMPLIESVKASVKSINNLNKTMDEFVDPALKKEREEAKKAAAEQAAIKNAEYQARFREKQAAELAKREADLLARAEAAEAKLKEVEVKANAGPDTESIEKLAELDRQLAQAKAIAETNAAEADELAQRLAKAAAEEAENTAEAQAQVDRMVRVAADAQEKADGIALEAENRLKEAQKEIEAMKHKIEIQPLPGDSKPWGLISAIGLTLFMCGWMLRSMIG